MLASPFHGRPRDDRSTAPIDEEGDAHLPELRDLVRLAAEAIQRCQLLERKKHWV